MKIYRKQRINNIISYLAEQHTQQRRKPTFQTDIYKLIAHFEFELLKETGEMPIGYTYRARQMGPVPVELYENNEWPESVKLLESGKNIIVKSVEKPDLDYLSIREVEILDKWLFIFADSKYGTHEKNESSHSEIKSWGKTIKKFGLNSVIDPAAEFDHDPINNPKTIAEEHYKMVSVLCAIK